MFRYDDSLALADFGIAKNLELEAGLTATGSVVGTPSYMSPEQCEGRRSDVRSDLYALGIVIYEMLTGQRPFSGESAGMLFMQHLHAPVPRLAAHLAHCQPIIDRLMEKRPEDRFGSADEVVRALEALSADSAQTAPGGGGVSAARRA
jgi:serine/threonine-protein kinase PpkA